jgi:signal transduction histidine kinase
MSLRTRLFLVFGALMGLMFTAEWALVTSLSHELEQEVAEVAFEAGSEVLGSFFPEIAGVEARPRGGWVIGHGGRHSRTFAFHPAAGLEDLHGVLSPLHDELLRGGGMAIFRQAEVITRARADERSDSPRRVRIPSRENGPTAEHMLVLSLRGPGETHLVDLTEGFARGSDLNLDDHSFQIHMQLAERAGDPVQVTSAEIAVELGLGPDPGTAPPTVVMATANEDSTGDEGPMTVEIPISSKGIEQARHRWLQRLLLGSAAILLIGLVAVGWLAHRVSRPLRELSKAASEVGAGALGTQAPQVGDLEVGGAISAFNHMSSRLADLDAEARSLREREHLTEIGEMARGLAHALRNPLHLLGLSVEQLAARTDEEGAALSEAARSQIQRIDRSLRSFLALSSGGAGSAERVSVDDLARDVALELVQEGAGAARVEVEAKDHCTLLAVNAELRAVVHVLVVNAVEASPEHGKVKIKVRCAGPVVTLEVFDEGPGLPPQVRARLFTPHLTTKPQGAGMGLFLAQRIAGSRYGGQLTLEDRPGGGTVARLELQDRRESGAKHRG